MRRGLPWQLVGLLLFLAAGSVPADEARGDLYFSEALFCAQQGHYFDALQRLDAELAQHHALDEPALDSLYPLIDVAKFSVGDFELSYRMHHRAGRAITAVLEGDVDQAVRNEAAYRLARIHFQKGQLVDALQALDRIEGRMPAPLRDDADFLRASIYLYTARPEEATPILKRLQGGAGLDGFPEYNLAIAYLQEDRRDAALQQLDRAGGVRGRDENTLAIRDKANLVRGTLLLESGAFSDARHALDRVRLEGPFSNQALLSAGWAEVSAERYEQALAPWNLLVARNSTDASVQEALLALPYAYSRLDVHGRAAVLYGQALQTFQGELHKLDASVASIRSGKFLQALVREEIRNDKDWVIRLRSLPETPETYYLMELMASHDFQTALQNYLDLEDLRGRMVGWQRSFAAYEDILDARRSYYEPMLPGLDQQFRELDSRRRLRLEQHRALEERLQSLLVAPRPDFLATSGERELSATLRALEAALIGAGEQADPALLARLERLRGVVTWSLKTQYHARLTEFYAHLEESRQAVEELNEQYNAFVRVRQAATHSYVGYEIPIQRLRTRVREAAGRIDMLMARQGRVLETVAIRELESRIRRLEGYQDQARYALADSYDRATKAQSGLEGGE